MGQRRGVFVSLHLFIFTFLASIRATTTMAFLQEGIHSQLPRASGRHYKLLLGEVTGDNVALHELREQCGVARELIFCYPMSHAGSTSMHWQQHRMSLHRISLDSNLDK